MLFETVSSGGCRSCGSSPARLDEFHIVNVTTRADAVVIHFELSLSVP